MARTPPPKARLRPLHLSLLSTFVLGVVVTVCAQWLMTDTSSTTAFMRGNGILLSTSSSSSSSSRRSNRTALACDCPCLKSSSSKSSSLGRYPSVTVACPNLGPHSGINFLTGHCECLSTYVLVNNRCILPADACKELYGRGSIVGADGICECKEEYVWYEGHCTERADYCHGLDANADWDKEQGGCVCAKSHIANTIEGTCVFVGKKTPPSQRFLSF